MRSTFRKQITIKKLIQFNCSSAKNELTYDIDYMFIECGINLFGYNKSSDTYWGKIIDSKNCTLHFTVNVEQLFNSNQSSINICIFHGENRIINQFYNDFYIKIKELDE